jgi:AcrR family transcriptional regulator
MGTKERRGREREAIRTKILDAARLLFVSQGYEGVSMRAIAEKIEYSPTLIYQYFQDKETLLKELCHEDFSALAERLKDTLAISDPIERLKQSGREYVKFAIAYPKHYQFMFMTQLPLKGDKADWEEKHAGPELDAYSLMHLLVQKAAEEGALRDPHPDIDLIVQTLWAGLHGVIALEIVMARDSDWVFWRSLNARTEAMLDSLGSGLFAEKR